MPAADEPFNVRVVGRGADLKAELLDRTRDMLEAAGMEMQKKGPIQPMTRAHAAGHVAGQDFLPAGWMVAIGQFVGRLFGSDRFSNWATDRVIDLLGGGADDTEADLKVVEMVSKLVDTLDGKADVAAIDAGVFLFLKIKDGDDFRIVAKRLNKRDRKVIDDNPSLLLEPVALLEHIDGTREVDPEIVRDVCRRVRERAGLPAVPEPDRERSDPKDRPPSLSGSRLPKSDGPAPV